MLNISFMVALESFQAVVEARSLAFGSFLKAQI